MEFLALIWGFVSHPAVAFVEGAIVQRVVQEMFDRYKDRKKLQIQPRFGKHTDSSGNPSFELIIKNTGAKELGIHMFGYRTWYGGGVDTNYVSIYANGTILKPEQAPLDLHFIDAKSGKYLPAPDDAYFYFVETGDKVFKHYTRSFLRAKLKRLMIYLHQCLTEKRKTP